MGEDGNDTILCGALGSFLLDGGGGRDSIRGGNEDDTIYGDGSSLIDRDTIIGGSGNDLIFDGSFGYPYNDAYSSSAAFDVINAGSGNDSVFSGQGADSLIGGDGIDLITLWRHDSAAALRFDFQRLGSTIVFEGSGARILGFEIFNIESGTHDDFIRTWNNSDSVDGREGNDTIFSAAGDDSILGDALESHPSDSGNDSIDAGTGNDSIYSAYGNDTILGGVGSDYIVAGSGDDLINSGAGVDIVFGGPGKDRYQFDAAAGGYDQLLDFESGEDRILIQNAGFGGLLPIGQLQLQNFASQTANAARPQFVFDALRGALFWDADGTGVGRSVKIVTTTDVIAAQDIWIF